VVAIAETCRWLQQQCRDLGRLELNLTISNFTPKPHTPFQWHSVSQAEMRRRQELLRGALRGLRGLKVNTTDVRLSAVEDFVGRGDRRLAAVIEAAWRAGAGLDAWFESAERTHQAWTGAIEAAGLGGRYRALEMGSWSAAEAMQAADRESFCRQPLPWDHIDSGVDKQWLAADLARALEAMVVPDCSFEGCSHCGVCGPELGHNVVVPPPPLPIPLPRRSPPSERVARLRFGFAKGGGLALISHLDTLRLLERALRRSGLPVSFTGGFHPLPRLQLALPLPLGVEGEGEWLDLEFVEPIDPAEARARLAAVLPAELRLLSAEAVPVAAPSLSQELEAALWHFRLRPAAASSSGSSSAPAAAVAEAPSRLSAELWREAIDGLLAESSLPWHDHDKKGRPRQRECRPFLLSLALAEPPSTLVLEAAIDPQGRSLRPEQVAHWLGARLGEPLQADQVCRRQLRLRAC
jgi:radical SAM-linked protein